MSNYDILQDLSQFLNFKIVSCLIIFKKQVDYFRNWLEKSLNCLQNWAIICFVRSSADFFYNTTSIYIFFHYITYAMANNEKYYKSAQSAYKVLLKL